MLEYVQIMQFLHVKLYRGIMFVHVRDLEMLFAELDGDWRFVQLKGIDEVFLKIRKQINNPLRASFAHIFSWSANLLHNF